MTNSSRNNQPASVAGPPDATDPQSFAAHFREVYSRLTVVAAGVMGDREGTEDVVQDAAIIAFQRSAEFKPGSNFAAWLAEIVRRCALNERRKRKTRKTYPTDPAALAHLEPQRAATDPSPVAVESGELLEDQTALDDQLVAALKRLTDDARCCLLLRTVEKLSYAEISELMQMPEGTAMSHVHRSRAALRQQLSVEPTSGRRSAELRR